jgi:hypothetical protein
MPDPAVDQTKMIERLTQGIADHVLKTQKASAGIADNFGTFIRQLTTSHATFKSFLSETVKLPGPLRAISNAITSPMETLRENVINSRAGLEHHAAVVAKVEKDLERVMLRSSGTRTAEKLSAERIRYNEVKNKLQLEEAELILHEQTTNILGKKLAIEFAVVKGFQLAVKESFDLNKIVQDTTSNFVTRRKVFQDILEVQTRTGAASQQVLSATKALRGAGFLVRNDFQSTLETVLKMEQGLGVSNDNATQLARVFQINLGVPLRNVADDITKIAGQTSLAADEAARYAVEVGKALRNLGPGGATQVREVTKYVTALAASMKDVGGDAGEITKLFGEMTKGSAQGFLIRGMSGVNDPRAVGTNQGSQRAFQGIGRIIDTIVRSEPGTRMYLAQLESASQFLNMSTESIILYKQALAGANKPLDEAATLQKHWEEQIMQTGEIVKTLEHSFGALLRQGFIPVLKYGVVPVMKGLDGIFRFISTNKVAMVAALGAVYAGIGYTIFALTKFVAAMALTAATSLVAAKAERVRQIELGLGMVTSKAGLFGTLAKLGGPLAMFARSVMVVGPLLANPFVWGTLLAGGIGVAIGYALSPLFEGFFDKIFKIRKDTTKTAYIGHTIDSQGLTWQKFDALVAHSMAMNGIKAGFDTFRQEMYRVRGFYTGPGFKANEVKDQIARYIDKHLPGLTAQYRERIALATVTAEREQAAKHDKDLIEVAQEQVDTLKKEIPDLGARLVRDRREADQKAEDEDRRKEMLKKTSQPLTPDPWARTKDNEAMFKSIF